MRSLIFCLVVVLEMDCVQSADKGKQYVDYISKLPGAENLKLSFRQFSGFFKVSKTHRLHYWFVESQNNPKKDPIIFWFNGGPSCSSLHGLLQEMGPIILDHDGKTLKFNHYAWNKNASIVYLESPYGVGYSHSTDSAYMKGETQKIGIRKVALENHEAMKQFYGQFPEYRNNPVFLMGESYAALYVTTLASRIIDRYRYFWINLQGIAIGNGLLDEDLNRAAQIEFAYGRGFYDESHWVSMGKDCCNNCLEQCNLDPSSQTANCRKMSQYIEDILWITGLNPYDVYRDCDAPVDVRLFQRQSGKMLYDSASCANHTAITSYMNNKEVRAALRIPEKLPPWHICSNQIAIVYRKKHKSVKNYLMKALNWGVRFLLYYGDTDMVCSFIMGQQFVNNLNLELVSSKEPLFLNGGIIGFQTQYDKLTLITIMGVGHSPAQHRAPEMQYIIQKFLSNESF